MKSQCCMIRSFDNSLKEPKFPAEGNSFIAIWGRVSSSISWWLVSIHKLGSICL